jgi:hypothetical protein
MIVTQPNEPVGRVAQKRDVMAFEPTTYDQLRDFSAVVAKSGMAPKAYAGKPDDVLVAFVMGSELGLKPLQALQNIAVINGRPAVWGDALLALVLAHRDCLDVRETFEADNTMAVCTVLRRGRDPIVRTFSVADAKQAKLWSKEGPWQTYPMRMLSMRARGFACRDAFPDALRGIVTVEEARDIPAEVDVTERGEVVGRPGETRADIALRALANTAKRVEHQAADHVEQAIDVETGEIREPVAIAQTLAGEVVYSAPPGERQIPPDSAKITTPEELRACFGRIDRAETVEAVNMELDFSRSFSRDAKREAGKRAALRIKELTGK